MSKTEGIQQGYQDHAKQFLDKMQPTAGSAGYEPKGVGCPRCGSYDTKLIQSWSGSVSRGYGYEEVDAEEHGCNKCGHSFCW